MKNALVAVVKRNVGGEEVNAVDARELHEFLGSKQQFSNWIRSRVIQYDFVQGIDFIAINNSIYSPPRKDYTVSLNMAKELSMVERSEKGKEARRYFIDCEKKLNNERGNDGFELPDFNNPAEAARAFADQYEQKMQLQLSLKKVKPLVNFAEQVTESRDCVSVGDFAKAINSEKIKIGRNRLFKWMRDNKYLLKDNRPYQAYLTQGYFKVIEQTYENKGVNKISFKTLITGKGQIYFTRKLIQEKIYKNN